MLKYNDRVLVISDPENDGFYEGVEGLIKSFTYESAGGNVAKLVDKVINKKEPTKLYEVWLGDRSIWVAEDQLQKI
jgi:hypothetical protein